MVDDSGYTWGEVVAQPLPEFEVEAAKEGAIVEGTVNLTLPPDLPPGPYALQSGFATAAGEVGQFPLPPAGSQLTVSGPSIGPTKPGQLLEHMIAPGLRLQGYDLSGEEATPGDSLWLTLYWQAVEAMPDYTLALRLLDPSGQAVMEEEIPPVSAAFPTSDWPAPGYVRGPHRLSLPKELAPGQYQFDLTLAGATGSDSVKLGSVNIVTRKAVFDLPPVQFSANAVFGDVATLLGYDLAGSLSPEGAHVTVSLYWQAQKKTAQPYQVKLRLVDGNSGSVLVEQMAEPVQGAVSTHEWQMGEIITDRHELVITNSQPTSVNLEIQLLTDTLQPVSLADGQPQLLVPEVQQKVSWRTP